MSPTDQRQHIMLVDDDHAGNHLTRILLEEELAAPFHLLAFTDPRDALAYLAGPPPVVPVLILIDLNMPGMGGFTFLDTCLADDLLPPGTRGVVIITSSIDPDSERRAQTYEQVLGIEEKPVTPEEMARFIARYLPDLS